MNDRPVQPTNGPEGKGEAFGQGDTAAQGPIGADAGEARGNVQGHTTSTYQVFFCNKGHQPLAAESAGEAIECPQCSEPMLNIGWFEEIDGGR